MSKVKAGLRGLSASQKVTHAAVVYSAMNGNANYPNPEPSMAEFHAAYIELKESVLAAMDRGRMAIARKNRAEAHIDRAITALAAYVNSTCAGDPEKLIGSGFFFVRKASSRSALHAPQEVTARHTGYPDRVAIKCRPVPGAIMYEVEHAVGYESGEPVWVRTELTSRPSMIVETGGLHKQLRFRIRAYGSGTLKSPYSQEAFLRYA